MHTHTHKSTFSAFGFYPSQSRNAPTSAQASDMFISSPSTPHKRSQSGNGGSGTDDGNSSMGGGSSSTRSQSLFRTAIDWSPLSRRRSWNKAPMPDIVDLTPQMFTLECAVGKKEFFTILMQLLLNQQAENRLRLLCALLDFKAEPGSTTSKKARGRKLTSLYLLQGSAYEVEGIPSHVLKMDLEESCDYIKHIVLAELVKLAEVSAALESDDVPDSTTEQKEQLKEIYNKSMCYYSDAASTPHCNNKLLMEDLAMIGQLERVISNAKTRKEMIQETLACSNGGVGVRIRFVSAVDQYMDCGSEVDKKKLGETIRALFVRSGGMFSIEMNDRVARSILEGNFAALENARLGVLQELCADEEVVNVVNALLVTMDNAPSNN